MRIKTKEPVTNGPPELIREDGSWLIKAKDIVYEVDYMDDTSPLGRNIYRTVPVGESDTEFDVVLHASLHQHSEYSLLDGMTKIPQLVEATEYAGALTDHGNMYGFLEFYNAMRKAGKKPILGFEAYMPDNDGKLGNYHLILLAKNNTGYKNLLKLTSESFDHVHYHPHVTWEMLEAYHEGIIATSACIGGLIPQYLIKNDEPGAIKALERLISIFGKENFFLEVQRHHLKEEPFLETCLISLADQYGLKIVATTDAHYPTKEDASAHEILLCLQRKATLVEPHWSFPGDGYYIRSSDEMANLFYDHPEWLDNTLDVADMCDVEVKQGHVNLPKYDIPAPFTSSDDYFEHLCKEGFQKRFRGTDHLTDKTYLDRYDYEMSVIKKMGFSGYFLIVQDYTNWARDHDIYVGPGRGSAAGSLLAYCLGITDIDPIRYDLLFERFLNPERVSMPD